jgi:flavin reductase (DIM6/NTAB) family NADH-FMN oxidoreductase RutF
MDPKARRRVLRLISNGMYVVTSPGEDDHAVATITWLTQISFDPPLIAMGVRPGSRISETLHASRVATIHLLSEDQQELAKSFFAAPELDLESDPPTIGGHPFEAGEYGARLLDARAWITGRMIETLDCGGDHNLVVLEVEDIGEAGEVAPLTVQASPWSYGG